jgi:hypothetical protein
MAGDVVEQATSLDSTWKDDSLIDASDSYFDVSALEDETKEQLPVHGIDAGVIQDKENGDIENTEIMDNVGEVVLVDSADIKDAPKDMENVEDEGFDYDVSHHSGTPVLDVDDSSVEWIDDSTTTSESPVCPIDPETGYESFCQEADAPSKHHPDKLVDFPESVKETNDTSTDASHAAEAESVREFIPTINSSRRERILSIPTPIVELNRPQLFGLRQLTIDPSITIEKTEALRVNARGTIAIQDLEITPVIVAAGSTVAKSSSNARSEGAKSEIGVENLQEAVPHDPSTLRFRQSNWRRSMESLRPLISKIPWLSPLLKRSTSEAEKTSREKAAEPETVSIQTRDAHRSPSDKPLAGEKEQEHTTSESTDTRTPIGSRKAKTMALPSQAIRNQEGDIDSASKVNPDKDSAPSVRSLELLFPGLIGLTLGRNYWRFVGKTRNKTVGQRPLWIENETNE